jgi:large subunit ribosomal protein L35
MARVKAKTRKAAAKRFKVTGTGRILFKRAGRSHLLSSKSSRRKRSLRVLGEVKGHDATRIRRMLPHG